MNDKMNLRPSYLGPTSFDEDFASNLGMSRPPFISLEGDKFTLMQIDGNRHPTIPPSLSINVILLRSNPHVSRIYWGEYTRAEKEPPICFSDNGIGPSINAVQPQSALCANCPRKDWTKLNQLGNMVPACSSRRKVAVLVAGAGKDIYLLSIPPATTTTEYQNYILYLKSHNAEPNKVITKIGWRPDKRLTFEFVDWVTENANKLVQSLLQADEIDDIINVNDKPIERSVSISENQLLPRPARNPQVVPNNQIAVLPSDNGQAPAKRGRKPASIRHATVEEKTVEPETAEFGMSNAVDVDEETQRRLNEAFGGSPPSQCPDDDPFGGV